MSDSRFNTTAKVAKFLSHIPSRIFHFHPCYNPESTCASTWFAVNSVFLCVPEIALFLAKAATATASIPVVVSAGIFAVPVAAAKDCCCPKACDDEEPDNASGVYNKV